jgi:phosphatidylserine/phosphatidylglycerophosphate/cardiolipin synthase-like enzyme
MRKLVRGDVTVNAIAGTHVVFFGFDMKQAAAKKLMGFAIQRQDKHEQELTWLRSIKSFASIRDAAVNEDFNSHSNPFQAFQWADYTAKPGVDYVYKIFPMFGKPGELRDGAPTAVPITTEAGEGKPSSVYFNRGAIASQAYAKRFTNQTPEKAGPSAFEWLTRDLLPGLLNFIGRAKDKSFGLHGAIFEFTLPVLLEALKDAARNADVQIIYGATPGTDTTEGNNKAIKAAKIQSICIPRKNSKLMHNKFIVLTKNKKPIAVWTGSTNFSRNALYGQLNVGHAFEDAALAQQYLNYWNEIKDDPDNDEIKDWIEEHNVIPPEDSDAPFTQVLAPHRGKTVFDWYTELAGSAKKALFMTFPFGIVKDFRPVYDHNDGILRYALLDKYVNGGNEASRQEAIDDTIRIRKFANVGMALGSKIFVDTIDGWMKEGKALGVNVNWVHTKFMLVDPLGDNPLTVSGSANWSLPSTNGNDENMVVTRGDKRVADIYFTEFMRIFAHHRFREAIARHLEEHGSVDDWKPQDLKENPDEWVPAHYKKGSEYELRRAYFVGE